MLERLSIYNGLDDDEPIPEREISVVWTYRQAIRSKCELPERPPHALTPEIADQIRFVHNDIAVLLPEGLTRNDAFGLFLQHEKPGMMPHYMVDDYGKIRYDYDRQEAAFEASTYLPHHWDIELDDLLASYRRSLDPQDTMRPGFVEFPAHDRVMVQHGIRRPPKPDPQATVEGLFYHQFGADEWHWDSASPQLFAAIEKNLEGREFDDPFEWARERSAIAAGYSALGGGKECSPLYLAQIYESMASTATNRAPIGHDKPVEYEIGEEEQQLLIELYGRHADTAIPEAVSFLLEHAFVLKPDILRADPDLRAFLTHLPEMLENGFNIDRIMEFTRAETPEQGTALERLTSASRLAMGIYRGQKPWWFKEDFDLTECFSKEERDDTSGRFTIRNDAHGRATLEQIAAHAGFAFQHVLRPYVSIGYRLAEMPPFTQNDAIDFSVFVTRHYGVGQDERTIRVLQTCIHILEQEEPDKRPARLKALREHLDDVKPQTEIIGALEARAPVFEMPGLSCLTATVLGKQLTANGEAHDLRIGFDHLEEICARLQAPLAERARLYTPALAPNLVHMERQGLLAGQSTEAKLALPMPEHAFPAVASTQPALGLFDFYAQLREECGDLDRRTAKNYFTFSAARMPDPWHPPKGFLKFLQEFEWIETPGWRFTALEHPHDRDRIAESNQRGEAAKQMLISNMLDAWIMGLLTTEELEGLCQWLIAELKDGEQIEIQKDVLHDWRERLRAIDDPPTPPREKTNDEDDEGDEFHPEPDTRTSGEQMAEADERIAEEVKMAGQLRRKKIQQPRLSSLQQTFTMLSAFNSMSIAGSFSRDELREVLIENILPIHLRSGAEAGKDEPEENRLRTGVMLKGLIKLQEIGALDHEGLRSAVEGSADAATAWRTMQDFIEQVLVRCMSQSLQESLPNAVTRVSEAMKELKGNPEEVGQQLAQVVWQVEQDLKRELTTIWDGAPFVAQDIVQRLLSEFRIPEYVELFPHIRRFNQQTVDNFPTPSANPQHKDLGESNAHSARTFFFVGGRIAQHVCGESGVQVLEKMREQHGQGSHVDLSGGTQMITDLTGYGDSDLTDALASLTEKLPDFQRNVDRWRLSEVPLGPIGGRWHFANPVSDKHMELFTHLLSLGKTPFRMIHANTSLIVPGFMSRNEMRLFIYMLGLERLIDPSKPELQIGITGRLNPELCAYFGSSCMLGTAECAPFKIDSFVPDANNHALTAARIVAYDAYPESAGTRRNFELPFMSKGDPSSGENVVGRTDILGRWNVRWSLGSGTPDLNTMDDLDIAHSVGGALRHVQHGGPLKDAGLAFMERHREILGDYGLSDTLNAPWVYTRVHEAYEDSSKNPEHFNRCVKACMDVHFANAASFAEGRGAVYDVRQNIDMLIRQVETMRTGILKDPAYESDIRAILQATSYASLLS